MMSLWQPRPKPSRAIHDTLVKHLRLAHNYIMSRLQDNEQPLFSRSSSP